LGIANLAFEQSASEALATRLEQLIAAGNLPQRLSQAGIQRGDLPILANDAATQWTGKFNPRPFGASEALEVYEWAF
jgi:alcohol dehydrogenase class IV